MKEIEVKFKVDNLEKIVSSGDGPKIQKELVQLAQKLGISSQNEIKKGYDTLILEMNK